MDTAASAGQEQGESLEERITAFLAERGKLSNDALVRARLVPATDDGGLLSVLTKLGLVSEADLASAYAACLDLTLVGKEAFPEEPILGERLNRNFLKRSKVVPISETESVLVVAMANPGDAYAVQALELVAKKRIERRVALPVDIEAAIDRLYGAGRSSIDEISDEIAVVGGKGDTADVARLKDMASEAPVIRLVNLLISDAIEVRASDIHIEPEEGRLRVRYRVDGVLREVEAPPRTAAAAIISRVKVMAGLNIAERRLSQDGRIRLAVRGREIDFRVSTTPTMHGESVVLRILDRASLSLDFADLGFGDQAFDLYLKTLNEPHGIILVTGPTGSGKTTTLYASLNKLNSPELKILTVEDPVEYMLEGINQVQVNPQIGLTFASALRSFLRQDPDIMMVGEIRDLETAQIAVQASLTGHLVLSTLHTNDAPSAITRLVDMGVEDFLISSTINGIVGQRLVRTLCPECREPFEPSTELRDRLGLVEGLRDSAPALYRAKGCAQCGETGFKGRTAIVEVLVVNDAIRELVLGRATAAEFRRAAIAEGMCPMYEDGMRKALAGVTTPEEVLRVTREF